MEAEFYKQINELLTTLCKQLNAANKKLMDQDNAISALLRENEDMRRKNIQLQKEVDRAIQENEKTRCELCEAQKRLVALVASEK